MGDETVIDALLRAQREHPSLTVVVDNDCWWCVAPDLSEEEEAQAQLPDDSSHGCASPRAFLHAALERLGLPSEDC